MWEDIQTQLVVLRVIPTVVSRWRSSREYINCQLEAVMCKFLWDDGWLPVQDPWHLLPTSCQAQAIFFCLFFCSSALLFLPRIHPSWGSRCGCGCGCRCGMVVGKMAWLAWMLGIWIQLLAVEQLRQPLACRLPPLTAAHRDDRDPP